MKSIIITGNRSLTETEIIEANEAIYKAIKNTERIITGCATGVDSLAANMGLKSGKKVHIFCVGGAGRGYPDKNYYNRLLTLTGKGAILHLMPVKKLNAPLKARLAIRRKDMINFAQEKSGNVGIIGIGATFTGGTGKAIAEAYSAGIKNIRIRTLHSEEIPNLIPEPGYWGYLPEEKNYRWVDSRFL